MGSVAKMEVWVNDERYDDGTYDPKALREFFMTLDFPEEIKYYKDKFVEALEMIDESLEFEEEHE